jgi:hypothetical protein
MTWRLCPPLQVSRLPSRSEEGRNSLASATALLLSRTDAPLTTQSSLMGTEATTSQYGSDGGDTRPNSSGSVKYTEVRRLHSVRVLK